MLDVFIIEEIKRREREREIQQEDSRPRKELPLPTEPELPTRRQDDEEDDRGVVIIDYSINGYSM